MSRLVAMCRLSHKRSHTQARSGCQSEVGTSRQRLTSPPQGRARLALQVDATGAGCDLAAATSKGLVGDTGARPTPVASSNRTPRAVDCGSHAEVSVSDSGFAASPIASRQDRLARMSRQMKEPALRPRWYSVSTRSARRSERRYNRKLGTRARADDGVDLEDDSLTPKSIALLCKMLSDPCPGVTGTIRVFGGERDGSGNYGS